MSNDKLEKAAHDGQSCNKEMKRNFVEMTSNDRDGPNFLTAMKKPRAAVPADELTMSNELILRGIFKHLRTADLVKDCRRVNKQWNRVATEALKKRSDACVKVNEKTDFEALATCIKSSFDFPFRAINLKINCHDFNDSPEKWLEVELFRQCASVFTRLKFASRAVPDHVVSYFFSRPFKKIVSLRLGCVLQQVSLKLDSYSILQQDNDSISFGEVHVNLENLKCITMENAAGFGFHPLPLQFLEALLESCPNLQRTENFTYNHLPALSNAGKLRTVKSLRVCSCNAMHKRYPTPSGLETLIITNGNHGTFTHSPDQMTFSYLMPLLESNQGSLRRIEVYTRTDDGQNSCDWPRLTKLTSIKIAGACFFPNSVTEIFPALKTVTLETPEQVLLMGYSRPGQGSSCDFHVGDYIWKKPLPSVTKLEVFQHLRPEDWVVISNAVPNVRHIFLDWSNLMDLRGSSMCFEQPPTCHISPVQLSEINLDEFFTGIPGFLLENLRKYPELPPPPPKFIDAVLRKKSNLAYVSGLRELVFYFHCGHDVQKISPISHVALKYGFNMAPSELQIRFMYNPWSKDAQKIREALIEASDRVTFDHWNADLGQWGGSTGHHGDTQQPPGELLQRNVHRAPPSLPEPVPFRPRGVLRRSNPVYEGDRIHVGMKPCAEEMAEEPAIMSNDLVLKCIFNHLSTANLVTNCRLVSKSWNRAATGTLKKRSDAYVRVNEETNFQSLADCIKSSPDFPFRELDLDLDLVCNLDYNREPEKWLEQRHYEYSSTFTRLRLAIQMFSYPAAVTVLTGLLSGPFKHIQTLKLNAINAIDYMQSRNQVDMSAWDDGKNNFKLEQLKFLSMGNQVGCTYVDVTFLEALLQSCPNLQRIENISNAHLHAVSRAGKLGTVKALRLCTCIEKDKNCPAPSGLEKLIIAEGYCYRRSEKRIIQFTNLQPLLVSSRDVLKHIEVHTQVVDDSRSSDWPTLSKLTSLKLLESIEFPHSVNDIFPVLQIVHLDESQYNPRSANPRSASPSNYLWKEPLPSVTKLKVFMVLNPAQWLAISRAVPNVQHIFLKSDKLVDYWCGETCFKHLETVHMSPIELPGTNWDRLFTGIPESLLEDLRKNPEIPIPTPEFIDLVLRERKSIASLSGLKELVVPFTTSDEFTQADIMITKSVCRVALQYGLAMAGADLKIRFWYDHFDQNAHLIQQGLLPASERVTFGHKGYQTGVIIP